MPRWFTPVYRRPDNPAYRAYCNMFVRQPLDGYAATCAALREADLTEVAKNVSVPTLCLVGDQDGSTPPTLVRELASLIPEADFAEIAASGHIPCIEQPDAYVSLLRNFISNRF
jgi:3-oxoadipate enol-lactonase